MSRALIVIRGKSDRERAAELISRVPEGTRVEVKASRRSVPQNSKFWALLTEVAAQLSWHGQRLRPDEWRLIFLDALKREARLVPNIDGNGFVELGKSSSDLTKQEMSDLLELIVAFGAEHGVKFNDTVAA